MRPADFRSSTIIITDPKLLGIPNGRYIEQLNIFQVAFVKFMTVVVFVYLNWQNKVVKVLLRWDTVLNGNFCY